MQTSTRKADAADLPATIKTSTLARLTDRRSASIRKAFWRNGHFNGIKPIKTPAGRLLWPVEAVKRLLEGE